MKLAVKVKGEAGIVVGYAPGGPKNKIHAIVLTGGELRRFLLKDVEVQNVPDELQKKPKAPRGKPRLVTTEPGTAA